MVVVPALHPASILRAGDGYDSFAKFDRTTAGDFKKAARMFVSHPVWDESVIWEQKHGRYAALFPTEDEVYAFLGGLRTDTELTVDVETTGEEPLDCRLICVGLGYGDPISGRERVICVPFISQHGAPYWLPDAAQRVQAALRWAMGNVGILKLFHNGAFDSLVMAGQGMPVQGWANDSMAAHHVLDSELPHGLGFVGSLYLDTRYWKDDVKGSGAWLELPDITLRSYNLRDILVTRRIMPSLMKGLRDFGLTSVYLEELELCRIMLRASLRGIWADPQRRLSTARDAKGQFEGLRPALIEQKETALATLRGLAGWAEFEPNKPSHLQGFFFTKLGFPVVKVSAKTGKPVLDKDALQLLELRADTPQKFQALKALVSYRQADKFLGTFVDGMPPHPLTGAIHASWKALTTSGRFASSPNMQNHSRKVKRMFRARRGFKFVSCDLSQAELRFIAYLSNDVDLQFMYEQGLNVHTVNTCLLFQVRCSVPEDTNPATEAYLTAAVPRLLGPKFSYASFPLMPVGQWKETRTLGKNFVFGCARFDTKIAVLDSRGAVEISKIVPGDQTWCWDGEKYAPTRILRAFCTGVQQCVKLTVKGKGKLKTVYLTLDHKMMTRSGEKRPLGTLNVGDRLMPFNRGQFASGYRYIDPYNDSGREAEHVWLVPGYEAVHHINEQRDDNRLENLQGMTTVEHAKLHWTAERKAEASIAAKAQWQTAGKANMVETLTAARVASEKWQYGVSVKGVETRARLGIKKPKTQGTCACGQPAIAKQLCRRCYNIPYQREYKQRKRAEQNHVIVSIEPAGEFEVWDLEVEHPAHNYALADAGIFISNSNYGAVAETLHRVLRSKRDPETGNLLFPKVTLGEIEALQVVWKRLHPALTRWQESFPRLVEQQRMCRDGIGGRIRWFRGGFKHSESLNFPVQAGVASWVNKNTIRIQSIYDLETGGAAQIVQQVHDALVAEVPELYAPRAAQVMEQEFNRKFPLFGFSAATLPTDKAKIHDYL